jgi:diketogulonate reductase-like aldo/keto reductase
LAFLLFAHSAHEQIPSVVSDAVSHHGVTFIDTASASHNERMIVAAIAKAGRNDVQTLTKIWYTSLGYGRTTLAAQRSLGNLASAGAAVGPVTVLLHWPRCNPAISWMDCQGEEEALPAEVKAAGPPPHGDPDGAWVESWRALEDMYLAGDIDNIGVSNFDSKDLFKLLTSARVKPQVKCVGMRVCMSEGGGHMAILLFYLLSCVFLLLSFWGLSS